MIDSDLFGSMKMKDQPCVEMSHCSTEQQSFKRFDTRNVSLTTEKSSIVDSINLVTINQGTLNRLSSYA